MSITVYPPVIPINYGVGQTPGSTLVLDLSTVILPANSDRSSGFLMNTGKDDVWIACDEDAILDVGILLSKNGGTLPLDLVSNTRGPINGICKSGATSTVVFQELNV